MKKEHHYKTTITWTGNLGEGTVYARYYSRDHTLSVNNKEDILCSSDTPFRGDGTKHNPEDFFLSALSSCHMLWYFHLCADAGVIVVDYRDEYAGFLEIGEGGVGRMTSVVLHPHVTIDAQASVANALDLAIELHRKAHEKCFIANSVTTAVSCEPTVVLG